MRRARADRNLGAARQGRAQYRGVRHRRGEARRRLAAWRKGDDRHALGGCGAKAARRCGSDRLRRQRGDCSAWYRSAAQRRPLRHLWPLRRRARTPAAAVCATRDRDHRLVRRQSSGAEGSGGPCEKRQAQAAAGGDAAGGARSRSPCRSQERQDRRPHRARLRGGGRLNLPFGWKNPYAWPRKPLLARNVVATSQPLAGQAGLQMLANGGTAVDAALAAAITLSLVEPVSNGIGSDAYAIVWDGKKLHGLNASGRSPAGWTPEYFRGQKAMPTRGWNTVSVPGCVSAWRVLSERFGKIAFEKLFEPAIRYGREGFLVSPTIAGQWEKQVPELKSQPGFAEAFMPNGRAPRPGEKFTFEKHAAALEKIAASEGDAFYRGELAEQLEAHAREHGGVMKASDLAAHRPDWVTPLEIDYRGYTLHELPPNGQGIVALIALGILQHFDVRSHPVDGPDSVHLQIEAMKLAFADARRYV